MNEAHQIMTDNRLLFPREARLLKAEEFRAVLRRGGRARAGLLRARLRPNGGGRGRLGLAIGRKASRGAVGRNRIRRQVRESFRLAQLELTGLDIVVSLIPSRRSATADLWRQLPDLWKNVARAAQSGGKWKG